MPLFWKPYTSDVTAFLAELKTKRPSLEAEQRGGRSLLWDRRLDRDRLADFRRSRVPQPPYVYFPLPRR